MFVSSKLGTRWSGPFTVVKTLPHGVVEVHEQDGNFIVEMKSAKLRIYFSKITFLKIRFR